MPHHCDEETGLTIGEAKRRERSIAFRGSTVRTRRMYVHLRCSGQRKRSLPVQTLREGRFLTDIDKLRNRSYAGLMNLQVPPELEAKLARLAAETGRTADQVALDLLASSVDHDEWFRAEVEKGRAAAREGRLIEHDDVAARMDRRYRG